MTAWQVCSQTVQAEAAQQLITAFGAVPVAPNTAGSSGVSSSDQPPDPHVEAVAEPMRLSPGSLRYQLDEARDIASHRALAHLARTGQCPWRFARLIAKDLTDADLEVPGTADNIAAALAEQVEARRREGLRPWTGPELRRTVAKLLHCLHPDLIAEVRRQRQHRRHITIYPNVEGLCSLHLLLVDHTASRIYNRLMAQARADKTDATTNDTRTLDQHAADIAADLLLQHSHLTTTPTTLTTNTTNTTNTTTSTNTKTNNRSNGNNDGTSTTSGTSGTSGDSTDTSSNTPNNDTASTSNGTNNANGTNSSDNGDNGARREAVCGDTQRQTTPAPPGPASGTRQDPVKAEQTSTRAGQDPTKANQTSTSTQGRTPFVADVKVVIRLETLLGLNDDPAEVDGNPTPGPVARALAADGNWQAWITHNTRTANQAQIIAAGTSRYTPGPRLAALIAARQPHCSMPGCTTPAERCDLDHATNWPTGPTNIINLHPLCRRHHNLKTHGHWQIKPNHTDPTTDPPNHPPDHQSQTHHTPNPKPHNHHTPTNDQTTPPEPPAPPAPTPTHWTWTTPNGRHTTNDIPPPLADL